MRKRSAELYDNNDRRRRLRVAEFGKSPLSFADPARNLGIAAMADPSYLKSDTLTKKKAPLRSKGIVEPRSLAGLQNDLKIGQESNNQN